ncbi:MAG: hypothetical protein MUO54_09760 [Anaerolineales bacterium]|nr:hypothetical protein [Anaerolineales bacterium]
MQNQIREALSLADEAYRLATDHGFVSLVKKIEGIRSKIARKKENKIFMIISI